MGRLWTDGRGASAIGFALVAPLFVTLVVGIAQLGIVFLANAGLSNAVAQGARHATLFPRPTQQDIKNSIDAAEFGLDPAKLSAPTVVYNTTASPNYADIRMSYTTTLNYIVYQTPMTLTKSRRVYMQPLPQS